MKTKINIKFILIALIGLSFSACKKENAEDDHTQNNDDTTTCRIKKITDSDGEITEFSYDSNNRLVEIASGPTDPETMHFSYDTDNHLFAMSVVDNTGTNATTVFTYTNDVLSSAVVTEGGSVQSHIYYHYDNGILHDVEMSVSGTVAVKTVFYYTGDNLSKMEEYSLNATGNLSFSNTITYQYDNKKNPLYELGIAEAIINEGHAEFASKNNIVQRVQTNYGSGTETISYQYNNHNYPTEGTSNIDGTATITYFPCE